MQTFVFGAELAAVQANTHSEAQARYAAMTPEERHAVSHEARQSSKHSSVRSTTSGPVLMTQAEHFALYRQQLTGKAPAAKPSAEEWSAEQIYTHYDQMQQGGARR